MSLSNYIQNAAKNRMASKRPEIVSKGLLMVDNGFTLRDGYWRSGATCIADSVYRRLGYDALRTYIMKQKFSEQNEKLFEESC